MSRGHSAFERLLETTLLLNQTQDEREILAKILKAIRYVMDVEASSLLLLDSSAQELYFDAIEGGKSKVREIRLKVGEGIAGWVCRHGRPLLLNNVQEDKRFSSKADKTTGFITKNMLCVPLDSDGKRLGVLQAINKRGGRFQSSDRKIFQAFAAQAAVAIDNARLYSMAFEDSLTKVYGRRYFEIWLEKELLRAQRYGQDFSLLLLDLDHFKKINDRFGHLAGDYALKETAGVLKTTLRNADILARYGGEEFIMILPNANLGQGAKAGERLRAALEAHQFRFSGQRLPVTASIGVTSFKTGKPADPAAMIRMADAALYKAKNNGRNQMQIWRS